MHQHTIDVEHGLVVVRLGQSAMTYSPLHARIVAVQLADEAEAHEGGDDRVDPAAAGLPALGGLPVSEAALLAKSIFGAACDAIAERNLRVEPVRFGIARGSGRRIVRL